MQRWQWRLLLAGSGEIIIAMYFVVLAPSLDWLVAASTCCVVGSLLWPLGRHPQPMHWTVSEAGTMREVKESRSEGTESWQFSHRSKILPFALHLVVCQPQRAENKSYWILPWQVTDENYRRLARIVFRQGLK